MVTNGTYEYAIKYRVIKLSDSQFFMIPMSINGGLSDGIDFSTDKEVLSIANNKSDFKKKYVVDNVYTTEQLEEIYDYHEDTDFLSDYFYDDYKDTVYLVNIENNKVKKFAIDLSKFEEREYDLVYFMDKTIPAISLNYDAMNEVLQCEDVSEMKLILNKYRTLLKSFSEFYKKKGVTKINVNDGNIESIESNRRIIDDKDEQVDNSKIVVPFGGVDVSYTGLSNYIKERVYGHDEEIDLFAQKLFMNYTAEDGESIESIMFVGPTGTGKTETVRAACEYLYIPYFETNAANLVPQGIRGTSIEDVAIGLYELSGKDLTRAQRGLVFLDEYDKLNLDDLDIKKTVKKILLSFNDGSKIPIRDDEYNFIFDSKMTNKVYAGVFKKIYENERSLGFGAEESSSILEKSDNDIRQKIIDKGYFSLEELSRITTLIGYDELTRDTKKMILLSSKISEFAKKRSRYKRQFGVDLIATDDYIDALLDQISNSATGMRSVNNFVKRSIDNAERELLTNSGYKVLRLTKDTVSNPKSFDLS